MTISSVRLKGLGGLKFKFIERYYLGWWAVGAELLKVTRNEIVSRPSLQISSSLVTENWRLGLMWVSRQFEEVDWRVIPADPWGLFLTWLSKKALAHRPWERSNWLDLLTLLGTLSGFICQNDCEQQGINLPSPHTSLIWTWKLWCATWMATSQIPGKFYVFKRGFICLASVLVSTKCQYFLKENNLSPAWVSK